MTATNCEQGKPKKKVKRGLEEQEKGKLKKKKLTLNTELMQETISKIASGYICDKPSDSVANTDKRKPDGISNKTPVAFNLTLEPVEKDKKHKIIKQRPANGGEEQCSVVNKPKKKKLEEPQVEIKMETAPKEKPTKKKKTLPLNSHAKSAAAMKVQMKKGKKEKEILEKEHTETVVRQQKDSVEDFTGTSTKETHSATVEKPSINKTGAKMKSKNSSSVSSSSSDDEPKRLRNGIIIIIAVAQLVHTLI